MSTITIRGITADMAREIKKRAKEGNLSINEWLLRLLKQAVGLEKKPLFPEHDDLDELAGGWSNEEGEEVMQRLAHFARIDQDQWK
ncbi:MAG TPA: hypothetical protein PKW76_17330 [bacterium]|jgi:hypothetical protein|nr:hypothetical protein [bacterium]HPG47431.1 hypothetical protein [bacterium]HPM99774.1 hypothetical protein [bacterium]